MLEKSFRFLKSFVKGPDRLTLHYFARMIYGPASSWPQDAPRSRLQSAVMRRWGAWARGRALVRPPLPPSRTPSAAALRKWRNGPVAGGPEHECAAVDAWYESLNAHSRAMGHLGAASRPQDPRRHFCLAASVGSLPHRGVMARGSARGPRNLLGDLQLSIIINPNSLRSPCAAIAAHARR